jgi:hypothetical protein
LSLDRIFTVTDAPLGMAFEAEYKLPVVIATVVELKTGSLPSVENAILSQPEPPVSLHDAVKVVPEI